MRSPRDALFAAALLAACPALIAQSAAPAALAPAPAARPAAQAAAARGQRPLRADIRQRLDALQASQAARPAGAGMLGATQGTGALRWRVNGSSGALSRLRGSFALQGADLAVRGADLAQRLAPLFDGDAGTSFAPAEVVSLDASGNPAWVRLRQQVQGFPLAGHSLLLAFVGNDGVGGLEVAGQAREVHGVLLPGTGTVAPPTVAVEVAQATALAHLQLDDAALMAAPTVSGRAQLAPDGSVQLVQRVELVVRDGLQPLAVDVDAHTGAVLGVKDNRCFGTGNLVWDGVPLPFTTGKGKGNAYTTLAKAVAGTESSAPLSELTLVDVEQSALALTGTLTGRYASVFDLEAVLYSPPRLFPFSDVGMTAVGSIEQYEAFDHVNAYYWITRFAGWLGKVQGGLSSDSCIPVIVNYDNGGDGYVNAFYSPSDLDGGGGGYSPGYFVFGDFDAQTGDPFDDFSRDPSIVAHEYTHGMVDKAGFTFGDEALDTPSRAVNEAIADYAAASFLKDPRLGHAFMAHSADDLGAQGDALRDLSLPLTLPDNLQDSLGGSTGLPEEHDAGLIFGASLWSARAALKAKAADDVILNGLGGWPQSNAEAGFPVVTVGNADDAYAAFYFACFDSMMEDLLASGASGQKGAGKLLGAFLEHGLTGTGDDAVLYTFTGSDDAAGLAFTLASAFRGGLSSHRFALELAAGQALSVSVKGDSADATQVDFAFDDGPGDFAYPQPKKSAVGGTSASQNLITVNQAGTYVLTLTDTALAGGRYTLKLKLK